MGGYGKLWSSITESSLWGGSKEARLLFVTLLAKADATGFVEAAPSGLARLANLTRAEIDIALSELTAPDPESKSKVADGRRVAIVPRGVCLTNYEEYRKRRDDDEHREYMRNYMRNYRQNNTSVLDGNSNVNIVKPCKPQLIKVTQAEAEAETESTPISPHGATKKAKKIPLEISEKAKPFFEAVWNSWPKETPEGEKAHKGSRAMAERAFQKILDTEKGISPVELKFCGMLYAKADTLPEAEKKQILEIWDYRDQAVMHIATFYGPEKRPYRQFLALARTIIAERVNHARQNP